MTITVTKRKLFKGEKPISKEEDITMNTDDDASPKCEDSKRMVFTKKRRRQAY